MKNIFRKIFPAKKTLFLPLYKKIAQDITEGKILTREGNKFSAKTARNYRSGAFPFIEWEKQYGNICLEDINYQWAEQFKIFLMEEEYCKNTISVILSRLKAVLRRLKMQGIGAFDGTGIPTGTEMVTTVYNTIEQLQALVDVDLTDVPGLSRIRDIYVLNCFTGMRIGDLRCFLADPRMYIRNIGNMSYIDIKTEKVGEQVVIPVGKTVKAILDRYSYDFGKPFSYQYFNESIKAIAARAGLVHNVVYSRTEGGKRIDTSIPFWQLMSSHTARRTFATNAFLSGMPEKNIMLITGHRSQASFQRYIRCSTLDAAITIGNHSFFNIDMPGMLHISSINDISLPDGNQDNDCPVLPGA